MAEKKFNALPGFGLTMGFTLFYLGAIVLIPLGGVLLKTLGIPWHDFWRLATSERGRAAGWPRTISCFSSLFLLAYELRRRGECERWQASGALELRPRACMSATPARVTASPRLAPR